MPQSAIRKRLIVTLLACGSLASVPVSAETLEELDALSDLSANEAGGIAAARDLARVGQYLDALSMLERVLAVFPQSHQARLNHALYLCEIDDQQGGLVEIEQLESKNYAPQALDRSRTACLNGPTQIQPPTPAVIQPSAQTSTQRPIQNVDPSQGQKQRPDQGSSQFPNPGQNQNQSQNQASNPSQNQGQNQNRNSATISDQGQASGPNPPASPNSGKKEF